MKIRFLFACCLLLFCRQSLLAQSPAPRFTIGGYTLVNGNLTADSLKANHQLAVTTNATIGQNLRVNGDGRFEGDLRARKLTVQALEVTGATQGTPLSLGDNLLVNGSMGVGTTKLEGYRLSVNGKIRASDDIKVYPATGWSDFVFEKQYRLRSLEDVEKHIRQHGHLPEIPSAKEVAREGIELGAMDARLLQKIEELTLYMIELKKVVKGLQEQNAALEKQISTSQNRITK
jgi:hypothetical protein